MPLVTIDQQSKFILTGHPLDEIQKDRKQVVMGGIDTKPFIDLLYSSMLDKHQNKRMRGFKL